MKIPSGLLVLLLSGAAAAALPATSQAAAVPRAAPRWPDSLDAFRLCISNQPLLGVRNDASGLTADPSGGWWLVSNQPLAALRYSQDFSQLLQVVELPGVEDPEAIAWTGPGQLAVSEETRYIVRVSVPPAPPLVSRVASTVLINSLARGVVRQVNKGFEGLAYDPSGPWFYVAQLLFNGTGLGLKDFSELSCWGPACESLLILSQGSKRILRVDLQGKVLSSLKLKGLPRPEGLAVSADGRWMAVASEPNAFSLYSSSGC
ncbi:hypothetical protein GPECTOR_2g1336 [Gonium pectorale]|uniref:SMP-30/Gluconolactonase/LRE-like region domain-containing protein n=1 Tax=Gonium pectorale TaxID=33097 RepID=A0A150H0U5_GONPE|nr:hypothetical protein GPECTOR_2g1336 [Gonium pectorale]|eukprot:KXZ55786.1 hypothetical protein GPECTOR_2g1336 [Gonium pectorale]